MVEIESIKRNIVSWVEDNLGLDFKFRKYQLESIIFVIKSILNDDREISIIEAPTGSGKSLISIISAGVLSTYYNKSSYILCSDLFLWQQYADYIERKRLNKFGFLKGSQGNYRCAVNKMDLSCGRCKLAKVSYTKLKDYNWCQKNNFSCVSTCKYMQERFRAERCNITLMTYQLWLHYMNLADSTFKKRDVIFCDECHNIPDIVQQFSAPSLKEGSVIANLMKISDYAAETNVLLKASINLCNQYSLLIKDSYILDLDNRENERYYNDVFDNDKIKQLLIYTFDALDAYNNDNDKIEEILKSFLDVIQVYQGITRQIEDDLSTEVFNISAIDKETANITSKIAWFNTFYDSIKAYYHNISESGNEYLLLEVSEDPDTKERFYQFNCAKEDYLCYDKLLKHATNKVLLSATVGSHRSFDDNIGTKYTKQQQSFLSKIPTTFNYEKSPIYFIPKYKMSFANKAHDFPLITELAVKIINANSNVRGVIHTGSYENARLFYNKCPYSIRKRLFLYGYSKQKEEIMEDFKLTPNGILVGPTLTEGIDLPNDFCRFIILMKVPYPNITSKIVKKKLELFPLWYNSTTSNVIIQSIGRGVRNENDYCTTYILDGCFGGLFHQTKEQYPNHILERIKYLTC